MKPILLDPQLSYNGIHKFTRTLDPFHPDAFKGTPAEGLLSDQGPRKQVWAAEDWCGNIIAILEQEPPFPSATIDYIDGLGWCWV